MPRMPHRFWIGDERKRRARGGEKIQPAHPYKIRTVKMDLKMVRARLNYQGCELREMIEHLRAVGLDKIADRLAITATVLDELHDDVLDAQ